MIFASSSGLHIRSDGFFCNNEFAICAVSTSIPVSTMRISALSNPSSLSQRSLSTSRSRSFVFSSAVRTIVSFEVLLDAMGLSRKPLIVQISSKNDSESANAVIISIASISAPPFIHNTGNCFHLLIYRNKYCTNTVNTAFS